MPEVSVDVAAAVMGLAWEEAEDALEHLVDVALLQTPAPDRYRFHDLVRLFALERGEAEEQPEARRSTIAAAVDWYRDRAVEGALWLGPSREAGPTRFFPDLGGALGWFEAERENLVRAVARADEYDLTTPCWQLADALFRFFELRRYLQDWQYVNERALAAARRAGNRGTEGRMLNGLGYVLFEQGRLNEAVEHLEKALALRRQDGHRAGEGRTLKNLGDVHIQLHQPAQALAYYQQAAAIGREVGDRARAGQALYGVGVALFELGRYPEADHQLQAALAVLREVGDRPKEGRTLLRLAAAQRAQGRLDEAISTYRDSIAIIGSSGDRYHQGLACWHLGLALQARALAAEHASHQGSRGEQPDAYWRQALAIFDELAVPEAAELRQLLATTTTTQQNTAQGDTKQAARAS